MSEELGTKKEFDFIFKDDPGESSGFKVASPDTADTEPEKDEGVELEVKKIEPEKEDVRDDKPEEVSEPEAVKPEKETAPGDYEQLKQFRTEFEQFVPLLQGVLSLPEEEKRQLYIKMQGGAVQQQQPQVATQPPQADTALPLSPEQLQEVDEMFPGMGKAMKQMADTINALKAEQESTKARFRNTEEIAHIEKVVSLRNQYDNQLARFQKEFPEVEDDDIQTVKTIARGVLDTEIRKGNMNAEVDLYNIGKAYLKRLDNIAAKRTKKPSQVDGSNKPGVQKQPPAKIPIEIDKGDVASASSIGDVLDTMFAKAGI